jgi:hypothetical protein
MIDALLWGGVMVPIFMLAGGIRRIPWRYAFIAALGVGLVFAASRMAIAGIDPGLRRWLDPGTLVLLGAVGGSLSTHWWEHGNRERQRRSAAILGQSALSDSNAAP